MNLKKAVLLGIGAVGAMRTEDQRIISGAELVKHSTGDDCWVSLHNQVYDLTAWLPNHPGGIHILKKECGKIGTKSFDRVHDIEVIARKMPTGHIKLVGAIDVNAEADVAKACVEENEAIHDESTLSPFAKKALLHVRKHSIVIQNKYTEWFKTGEASLDQMKDLVVQFSVFSNLFLQAQLRKILNAPGLHEMREGKEILANEMGVVFKSEKVRKSDTAFDPNLVSTEGSVEGGSYSHKAAHFEWLLDVADSVSLNFSQVGKRRHGSAETLVFCDALYDLYGSEDLSTSLGASFAIEHWANAGFWDDLVDGWQSINDNNKIGDGKKTPLGFWLFHQALEAQHAAHTMDELEEAIEKSDGAIDEPVFLKAMDGILDATAVFWEGLHKTRMVTMN